MKLFTLFFFIFSLSSYAFPFKGTKLVVSGPSSHLSSVVQTITKKGGNIVDAAIASALSLSVTHPYYVSLGSGGFALIKMNSKILALDFREVAPQNMQSDFYQKTGLSSQQGGAAVGVPGFLKGLVELHKKYGKIYWKDLVKPALELARKGFPVSGDWSDITLKHKEKLSEAGQKIFFKRGQHYQPNQILKQPQLAKALRIIQNKKDKSLYRGDLGKDIVNTVQNHKGLMTLEDLKSYRVRWLEPISFLYREYKVSSMPLPSSGGVILARALKLIEKQKLYRESLYSVKELHLLGEIMARAFRPRNLMGDPDFMSFKNQDWLSDKKINQIHKTISPLRVRHRPILKEPAETTHISLMDSDGNAVAMTLTLNGFYGSKLVTQKYGIVLNNQMDDFTTRPDKANLYGLFQGKQNRVEGGKRPLSSMTPTLVEKKGKTIMVLGGAGGPTIITGVLQTLYRYLSHGLDIDQAIHAPRIHHQFLPRTLFVENKRFSPEVISGLKQKGHKISYRKYIGQIFGVALTPKGLLSGGREVRREGFSGGF